MKRLVDLEKDDIVYLYIITSFNDKKTVFNRQKAKVVKVVPQFSTATLSICNSEARHIIKSNEAMVYRNIVWLTKKDDKLAKDLFIKFFNRKIEIAENNINQFKSKIELINNTKL